MAPEATPAPERIVELREAELRRFIAERPRTVALLERSRRTMPRGVPMAWMDDLYEHPVLVDRGSGAYFTDVDGHTYLDMYIGDMSGFCGHAPAAVVAAVARRMELGNHFLLPGEDAVVVAEHLAERYGMPKWQFTLSATQANTEVIRLAFAPEPDRNAIESRVNDLPDLRDYMRLWMANHGIWESGWWLGPTVSVAHTNADVDRYLERFAECLSTIS